MRPRTIPAGEFKAKCLALLDEVATSGQVLIVTKRGKPVARVLPPEPAEDVRDYLRNSITILGDIVDTSDAWAEWDPELGLET
ncbi:MAG: type II toxin-antitoxin system Phd/YefM family antitoxin [Candidatus Sericytochromatia bacterium]|nr:type II toxin-antitoxin system Phd/YefM family antitoxin [Candidatus Tanganyikabacteria bacterium]